MNGCFKHSASFVVFGIQKPLDTVSVGWEHCLLCFKSGLTMLVHFLFYFTDSYVFHQSSLPRMDPSRIYPV